MTENEFLNFVGQCIQEAPEGKGLQRYLSDNGIEIDYSVSDEEADKMERLQGVSISAAGANLNTGNKWPLVFRNKMLDAPKDVIRAIVYHECIHMLLVPILHPRVGQIPLSQETYRRLRTIRTRFDRKAESKPPFPAGCDYEELLVTWIGLEWKTGEGAAHAWANASNAPGGQG